MKLRNRPYHPTEKKKYVLQEVIKLISKRIESILPLSASFCGLRTVSYGLYLKHMT